MAVVLESIKTRRGLGTSGDNRPVSGRRRDLWSGVKSATEQGIFRVLRLAVVVLAIVAVFALPAFGVAALIVAINR